MLYFSKVDSFHCVNPRFLMVTSACDLIVFNSDNVIFLARQISLAPPVLFSSFELAGKRRSFKH